MTEPVEHPSPPDPAPVLAVPVPVSARRRRAMLVSAAGGVAALAGAAISWRHWMPTGTAGGAGDEAAALWQQAFDTPAGTPLDMAPLRNRLLLVNFWATWCPPCVEELPLLDRFHRQQAGSRGWQVLGVAIDQPSAVRRFLQKTPVQFPVAMAGLQGTDLAKALGNTAGGLPFTVALGPTGQVLHRKMGQLSEADLRQWAAG